MVSRPRWFGARAAVVAVSSCVCAEALAVDSYRYLHVTIDTPWLIFLLLLPIVLSPFILMAWLYWRFAGRRPDAESSVDVKDPKQQD